jgi:hypothetical protein
MDINSFLIGCQAGKKGGNAADVRYVTFMSENGTFEYGKKAVAVGDDCADPIKRNVFSTPTKESTVQYNYSFYGWAATPNGGADANWNKNITEDKTVYANFSAAVRYYTIAFVDTDGSVFESKLWAYGDTPTITDPAKSGFSFDGWEPTITTVVGDATYTAKWVEAITFAGGAWEDIIRIAEAGEAQKYFALGDTKQFEYKMSASASSVTTTIAIVGFNHDDLADGTGKAAMSFLVVQDGISGMFPAYNTNYENGWPTCDLRTKLNNTVLPTFPVEMRNSVKQVKKNTYTYTGTIKTSDDYVWVPSATELGATRTAASASYDITGESEHYPGITGSEIFSGSLITAEGYLTKTATRSSGSSYRGITSVYTDNYNNGKITYTSESAYNVSLRTTFGFCI